MGLFKRYKDKVTSLIGRMAGAKLHNWYTKSKMLWANWMADRTARLTKKGWIIALSCFVLLAGGYSTYLIVDAFTGTPFTSINMGSIRKPANTGKTGAPSEQAEISVSEYQRIERFRSYMDSLARSPTGKPIYDSITVKRPGLMDSVRQLEKYYRQFKNK